MTAETWDDRLIVFLLLHQMCVCVFMTTGYQPTRITLYLFPPSLQNQIFSSVLHEIIPSHGDTLKGRKKRDSRDLNRVKIGISGSNRFTSSGCDTEEQRFQVLFYFTVKNWENWFPCSSSCEQKERKKKNAVFMHRLLPLFVSSFFASWIDRMERAERSKEEAAKKKVSPETELKDDLTTHLSFAGNCRFLRTSPFLQTLLFPWK